MFDTFSIFLINDRILSIYLSRHGTVCIHNPNLFPDESGTAHHTMGAELSIPFCRLIQRTAPARERLEQTYTEKLAEATRACNGCFLSEKSSLKNRSPPLQEKSPHLFLGIKIFINFINGFEFLYLFCAQPCFAQKLHPLQMNRVGYSQFHLEPVGINIPARI